MKNKMTNILSVESLCKRCGGVIAVEDVSFELNHGEIVGLLGTGLIARYSAESLS